MPARTNRWAPIAAVWIACVGLAARLPAGDLEMVVFDVGQADATLITCPDGDHHLLIDSADTRYPGSSKAFRDALQKLFPDESDRKLDVVVASHPHQDHIGSMSWVLENFTVDTYVDNGQKFDTASFGKLDTLRKKLVKNGKLTYVNGKDSSGEPIDFCPKVEMRLIEAWAFGELSDPNERSVGVWLQHGQKKFLFVGDMEKGAEGLLLDNLSADERKTLLDVDVLKVGHHGSDTSSTERFVRAVSPEHAIISAGLKETGTNKGYKHPRRSTIDTYNELAFPDAEQDGRVWAYDAKTKKWQQSPRQHGLWVTPRDGAIRVTCDGDTITVEPQGKKKSSE
jgi:competence protein ComEC